MSFQFIENKDLNNNQNNKNDENKNNENKNNENKNNENKNKNILLNKTGTSMTDDYRTFTELLGKYKTIIILIAFGIFLMNSNIFQNIFYILGALFIYMNISKVVNLRNLLKFKYSKNKDTENFIVLPPPRNRYLY